MAVRGGKPVIRITADADGVKRATVDAERSLDRLDRSGSKSLRQLKMAAIGAGAALTTGLVVGAKKAAEAAIDEEASQARVKKMVENVGLEYEKHAKRIDRVIQKQSQLSGLDDEELSESFANALRTTKDLNEAFEMNALAADVARTKGMDLAAAQSLLARVYNGSFMGVKRLGIAVEPVTAAQDALKASTDEATDAQKRAAVEADKQATVQGALAELQKQFSGQAKEYGETTAGSLDRAEVAAENLGETVGGALLPVIGNAASEFAGFVTEMQTGEGTGGQVAAVLTDVANVVGDVGQGVGDLVTGFQEGDAAARGLISTAAGLAGGFVAFKVGGAVVAGFVALKAAIQGVTAAIAANPVGAVLVGMTALITSLGVLDIKAQANTVSQRELTDAYRAQAEAMRQVADLDLDLAQRKANVRSATVAVEQAEQNLKQTRREQGKDSAEARQAEAALQQARISLTRATRELNRFDEDAAETRRRGREETQKIIAKEQARIDGRRADLRETEAQIRTGEDQIQVLQRQGFNTDRLREKTEKLRERAGALREQIRQLESKRITVDVAIKIPGATPDSPRDRLPDGWGVEDGIRATMANADPTSLFGAGNLPIGGTGLNAFNGIAAMFGVGVGSGFRPGAITSSGNVSYHALGRARDFPGPAGAMLAFAKYLAANFGSRLLELIYTPLGFSIKNGRVVPPYAQAAHYDHVHVAMRQGGKREPMVTDSPVVLFGETPTRDPEYFIPTERQFRGRALALWAQAGQDLGIPGFRKGGGRVGKKTKATMQAIADATKGSRRLSFIERDLALADLTADLGDDIAAADEQVRFWQSRLAIAQVSGRGITDAARQLKSAQDFRAGLVPTTESSGDGGMAELIAQQEETNRLLRERDARDKRVEQIMQTQGPDLMNAFLAFINFGVGSRMGSAAVRTPPGSMARL